jgi:hypothetical protein
MIAKLKEYLGLIVTLAMVTGIVAAGLAYFAKAADLELVQLRLDQKIVADQAFDLQRQIWALEDRNKSYADCRQWPDERDRDQYRRLKVQLDESQKRQEQLLKKK